MGGGTARAAVVVIGEQLSTRLARWVLTSFVGQGDGRGGSAGGLGRASTGLRVVVKGTVCERARSSAGEMVAVDGGGS